MKRWDGKITKRMGTRPVISAVNFPFWKEVSQNCFVFEVSQNSFVFKLADRQIDRYIDRQTDSRQID